MDQVISGFEELNLASLLGSGLLMPFVCMLFGMHVTPGSLPMEKLKACPFQFLGKYVLNGFDLAF